MILPFGDDQVRGGHFPLFSYGFIALNIVVFVYQSQMPAGAFQSFVLNYGAVPEEITQGQDLQTLFTSMFLHGGWGHLLGNMLFLWIFADNIEATIGNIRFLMFYILGGLAAHAGHILFNLGSGVPTVGASGAISAVMGAYLVMFPRSRIKMLFIFLIIRIPAWIFLGFWIYQQTSYGTQALQGGQSGGVAWWAHIGGFAFGVLSGFYYRTMYPKERSEVPVYHRDDLL